MQYAYTDKEAYVWDFNFNPQKKSENKTIRFPVYLIEKINQVLTGTDVSFSSFVIQACEFALDNMDHSGNNKNT